jgi:hypothetical protein
MRLSEEGIRGLIAAAIASLMVVVAVRLWSIDLLLGQSEFGVFLAIELVAFSMLLYLYTRISYLHVKKNWFLLGCLCLAFLLTLAILLR